MPRAFVVTVAAVLLAGGLATAPARAGQGLGIIPTRLSFGQGQVAGAITITNNDVAPALMEVHVFAWTRAARQDILEPTSELLASPPIFRVAPGASQVIRVGLRAPIVSDQERTFRVFVHQIVAAHAGVGFSSQFSLPVFVAPVRAAPRALTWSIGRDAKGRGKLIVANGGDRHEEFATISVSQNGKVLLTDSLSEYLMPQQQLDLALPPGTALDAPLVVDATTDAAPVHAVVTP
jgi:fimbrial chaperone protein